MSPDDDRLDAKTANAVVINLDEARKRRDSQPGILQSLRDPASESLTGFVILLALVFAAAWYIRYGR